VTQPATLALRALYNTAAGQVQDSVLITMTAVAAGVKIDRDEFQSGVQATPDTAVFNSLCTGQPNPFCQREFHAFVVDSALAPVGNQNAQFQWALLPPTGAPVTFTTRGAPANDSALVTAETNGFVHFVVTDASSNNFGADTLPILVQQLPYVVQISPDSQLVLVGGTATFQAAAVDQGGDTMPGVAIHWRPDFSFNPHLTIVDTATANQAVVRLDSTPLGAEYIAALAVRGPGDTAYGFARVLNPIIEQQTVGLQPWAIAANSQTHFVYVGHQGGQLYQVNGTTNAVTDSTTSGLFVAALAVNSNTNRVYAANDQGVEVLDGATLQFGDGAGRHEPARRDEPSGLDRRLHQQPDLRHRRHRVRCPAAGAAADRRTNNTFATLNDAAPRERRERGLQPGERSRLRGHSGQ
jgi:hypothetical protein